MPDVPLAPELDQLEESNGRPEARTKRRDRLTTASGQPDPRATYQKKVAGAVQTSVYKGTKKTTVLGNRDRGDVRHSSERADKAERKVTVKNLNVFTKKQHHSIAKTIKGVYETPTEPRNRKMHI